MTRLVKWFKRQEFDDFEIILLCMGIPAFLLAWIMFLTILVGGLTR